MLLAGKAHDARFHHFTQLHQVFKGVLIEDDAIDHGVDHALLKTAADESALRTLAFQHAEVGQDLDCLAHRAAGDAH